MILSRAFHNLRPIDALNLVFGLFLTSLILIVLPRIESPFLLIGINLFVSVVIIVVARLAQHSSSKLLLTLYDWYPAVLIYFVYKELYVIMHAFAMPDCDDVLIAIDRWMFFGVDPTVWLYQFSSPVVTEILQIAYTSFYFLMTAIALELYLKKEFQKFSLVMFAIVYGFWLSYIGYLLVPAVGPRFTLHDFHKTDVELPGLWLTEFFRDAINAGESIPKGAPNAVELAQRDVFPSGHTQMTLIVCYYAVKFKARLRYILIFLGILLIIGTVYLRYHYVIDLIAGALFMMLTVWSAPIIIKWWKQQSHSSL